MIGPLATALVVACLVAAAYSAYLTWRDRPSDDPLLALLALTEVALLVQVVLALTRLDRPGLETATFVSYLVTAVVVLPATAFWSLAERTRWGTGVLAAGATVTGVLVIRLTQVWAA